MCLDDSLRRGSFAGLISRDAGKHRVTLGRRSSRDLNGSDLHKRFTLSKDCMTYIWNRCRREMLYMNMNMNIFEYIYHLQEYTLIFPEGRTERALAELSCSKLFIFMK